LTAARSHFSLLYVVTQQINQQFEVRSIFVAKPLIFVEGKELVHIVKKALNMKNHVVATTKLVTCQ